ncbi:hypothetical protein [Micromonospora sp. NPDC007220]|uniref:AAA family ATPase n=1 Tax=Micromonospora sp. NPDC007220 TaxID=3154318 RepID=UPI003405BE91
MRRLGEALGRHTGAPGPVHLADWASAVDALLALGRDRPVTVVVDEFPYLARASRDLPSVIQHALTPGRAERTASRTRLLLCGSALSFMGGLLAGSAPLRGRAGLELPVAPLDYRSAAAFWGFDDPLLAAQVFAIVGGTPAYRREYVQDDTPDGRDDFDDWVVRAVLNPARPLFREARYLVALGESPLGDGPRPLLAIGAVKWGRLLGRPHLDRLERARELLVARPGLDARGARLLLASAEGFTAELRQLAAHRPDVVLVGPDRLYSGA